MSAHSRPAWIAADWGTSNLRLWLIGPGGAVIGERRAPCGMATLDPGGYEPALLGLLGDLLPDRGRLEVLCCGMAGARQGWAEAPYRPVPCAPLAPDAATLVPTRDPRLRVRILPGLSQTAPPDVMRGEETQIAGALAAAPEREGVFCLPGTHTKWVHVSAGEVVSFRTFMTGELFALLAGQSVLRHVVEPEAWDGPAFDSAVDEALSRPAALGAALFGIRAGALLQGLGPGVARARLSGLLIGLELAGARPYWLGQQVWLIAEPGLSAAYDRALRAQGVLPNVLPAAGMTCRGLIAAHSQTGATLP